MKASIYNPYLDTMGGGERYTLTFAKVLSDMGYKVDLEWKNKKIIKMSEKRFGIDLSSLRIVKNIKRGDGYEVCFWVSDGSIPLLRARRNFLHFQFPFTDVGGRSLITKMKLFRIEKIVCNSKFTKKFIDREYGVDSLVIYPPVSVSGFKPKRKKNQIVYVGRFSDLTQAKRQDVLIKAFKEGVFPKWKLVLAGGSEVGGKKIVPRLEKMARGGDIEILENPSFDRLKDIYAKSKIFWSAAGYGIDADKEPKKVEHFGITIVEAMASGCVPVVFAAGGPKEIVEDGKNGLLWEKESELIKKTYTLINDKNKLKKMAKNAEKDAKKYGHEEFHKKVAKLLKR